MRPVITASACFLLALSLNALADEPQCHRVGNDAARLKCYDDAYPVDAKDVAAPVAQPHAETPATAAPAAQSFGMTQQLRNQDAPPATQTQTRLAAVIVEATQSAGGVLNLTLDNGQRWTLLEGHRPGEFEAGDKVGIRMGTFGSYRIRNDSGGRILRVRRIQ